MSDEAELTADATVGPAIGIAQVTHAGALARLSSSQRAQLHPTTLAPAPWVEAVGTAASRGVAAAVAASVPYRVASTVSVVAPKRSFLRASSGEALSLSSASC